MNIEFLLLLFGITLSCWFAPWVIIATFTSMANVIKGMYSDD